jgi:hypothetical protein
MPDGHGPAIIPGLPKHLREIPGFDNRHDDRWREKWFRKRDDILLYREEVHLLAEHDPGFAENERYLCADDPKYYAAVWGWVYEPRARKHQAKHVPFVPFAFQCHVLDWLRAIAETEEQADGVVDKSRGIGFSWVICLFAVWGWSWADITTLLLSKTMSHVDKPNNINTLFGKALYLIDRTPDHLLPPGFDRDRDRTQLNIANPDSAAQIFGDSTTAEAGRSARATVAFVDEAPFIRDLKSIWRTLGGTTDHRIGGGSMSIEYGMDWIDFVENLRRENPDSVMTLDWPLNAYQDEAWREREYARRERDLDLPGYYVEIERNPWKGRTNIIYPEARSITFDGPEYSPSLPLLMSIDPGVVDDTAIIFGQPLDGDPQYGDVLWFDSYERNGWPAEAYAHLLTGIEPMPGVNDVCYGMDFSDRETQRIMAFMRDQPWDTDRVKFVMDPAGKQTDSGALSFQTRIIRQSKKSRQQWVEEQVKAGKKYSDFPKVRSLVPICEDLMPINNHLVRHQAARDLLLRSKWADTPGARRLAHALSRYRKQDPTARATREPVPIHDDNASHLATSFEYAACYASGGYFGIKKKQAAKQEPPVHWVEPEYAGVFA